MKKKIIPLLMAAVMLTGLCACSGKTPAGTTATEIEESSSGESVSSETTSESTKETETTTSESSEPEQSVTTSEETTETSTADSSAGSTETSTTTTDSKPVVKVSTAEKKKIKDPEYTYDKFTVIIPKVEISGKDMSAVNKKIKNDIDKKKWASKYSYYKNDNIVSVLVELDGHYDEDFERKVYNISVSTGKLMSDGDVVKLAGSTDKKFFAQIKKAYKKDRFGVFKGIEKQTDLSKKKANKLLASLRKKNLKRISYKYVDPYINSKGKLKWVSSRYAYDAEYGDTVLVHS